jgi:hypothetical protein
MQGLKSSDRRQVTSDESKAGFRSQESEEQGLETDGLVIEDCRVEISEELPAEQLLDQLGRFHFEVGGDVPKNGVKGSEANLFVCGHGHVMLRTFRRGG